MDPKRAASAPQQPAQRRKRKLKSYNNPSTGEVVETRGGNQQTLRAWKEEFGDETTMSCVVPCWSV
ncbi:hypothetical protein [Halomonas aestuarii]|uniref:hypothetical protein n=1 Tax=Halomonas aestuarii TaxID=1897729 RepID=UPI003CC57667